MGFPGPNPVRGLAARVATLAVGWALLLPAGGVAASPAATVPQAASSGGSVPAVTTPGARSAGSRAWIVVLRPGALSSDGTSGSFRLDTTSGRAAARVRAAAADHAIDRLADVGGFRVDARFAWAVQGFAARLTAGQLAALRRDPAVARVVPDSPVSIVGDTWPPGVRRVNGPGTETAAVADTDIDVAVLDTGIGPVGGPTGADAELNVVGGQDCRAGATGNMTDGHGHGTHVAGTIGARDNGVGVVGVAPGARLWSVRVFDSSGRGSTSTVICGIDWVAQWAVNHPGRPMVANMSLRGLDDYAGSNHCDAEGRDARDPEHQAICAASAAGVVFVVAAGNEHDNTDNYIPARYDEVITVAAISDFDGLPGGQSTQGTISNCSPPSGTEKDDTFARYSNFGSAVDIVAPGTCIRSLAPGTGSTVKTAVMTGTSMAAPHVSGAIGRYLVTHPGMSGETARRQLIASGSLAWASGTDPDRISHPSHALLRLVDAAALNASAPALVVWPGVTVVNIGHAIDRVTVPFDLQREGDLGGPVDLTLDDLPAGVTLADAASLTGLGGLRGSFELEIAAGAASGDYPVRLAASTASTGTGAVVTIRVDRTAPLIGSPWPRLSFRTGGAYDGSAPIRVSWSVRDDSSGVATVQLQRRGASWKRVASGAGLTAATTAIEKGATTSLRVRATDRAGNAGTSSVLSTRLLLRDSSSSRIDWQGAWRTVADSGAAGKSVRVSGGADATATLSFTGIGVAVVAPRGPGHGKLRITIDGRPASTVDLTSSSAQPRRIVFASGPLASGEHVISITTRKAGSALDALLVLQ